MKSVKPGRGPSAMGAFGSVFAAIFGVIWIGAAASMGAPSFMILFGFMFIAMAVVQGIYHFKNATGENRMSVFDITDHNAEPDPLHTMFTRKNQSQSQSVGENQSELFTSAGNSINFCPFCGSKVDQSHKFCPSCGKQIR